MIRVCIWCQQEIGVHLLITDLFSFRSLDQTPCCSTCLELFQQIDRSKSCKGCSREMDQAGWCGDCQRWLIKDPKYSLNHHALFSYNDFAKEWMQRYKFLGDVRVAEMLTTKLQKGIKQWRRTHLIVPMPSRSSSMEERGFNQVELLLEEARISYTSLLEDKDGGSKQSQKNQRERLETKQPFRWKEGKQVEAAGKKVLLVDDVYTTGRTMLHAVECLKEAKVEEIHTFSVFR